MGSQRFRDFSTENFRTLIEVFNSTNKFIDMHNKYLHTYVLYDRLRVNVPFITYSTKNTLHYTYQEILHFWKLIEPNFMDSIWIIGLNEIRGPFIPKQKFKMLPCFFLAY